MRKSEKLSKSLPNDWYYVIPDPDDDKKKVVDKASLLYHYIDDPNQIFHSSNISRQTSLDKNEQFELRFAIINFYFIEPYVTKIVKDAKISILGKMANVGGTLGLMTGFSLVSMFEIAYFFIRVCKRLRVSGEIKARKMYE